MRNKLSKLFPRWISGGKKVTRDGTYYYNPRELTPNQIKWRDRYLKLSTDNPEAFEDIPEEYHIVLEWENGWLDYSEQENTFFVWSLYSHRKENDKDGLDLNKGGDAMDIAANLAKKLNCRYIEFDTHRDPKEWELCFKKYGKMKVVSRQIRLDLNS